MQPISGTKRLVITVAAALMILLFFVLPIFQQSSGFGVAQGRIHTFILLLAPPVALLIFAFLKKMTGIFWASVTGIVFSFGSAYELMMATRTRGWTLWNMVVVALWLAIVIFVVHCMKGITIRPDFVNRRMQGYLELNAKGKRRWWGDFFGRNAIYIIILILVFYVQYFSLANNFAQQFISFPALMDVLNRSSAAMFLALGVGGVIVLTGTDLSAGRIMGLTAVVAASLLQNPVELFPARMFPDLTSPPIIIVMLFVMAIGGLIGAFNGFFVSKFKLHPFIVTLATMIMLNGVVLWYLTQGNQGGAPIGGAMAAYREVIIGTVIIFGTPVQYFVFYAIIAVAVMWFIWNKTRLGKNMYAVGANPEAANISGISVMATTIAMFTIAGILYGFSGFVQAGRIPVSDANTGVMNELDAIAACVIGGVSFTGGVGKIRGIVTGVILLNIISIALQWLRISSDIQLLITGGIILVAVAIDMRKYLAKK